VAGFGHPRFLACRYTLLGRSWALAATRRAFGEKQRRRARRTSYRVKYRCRCRCRCGRRCRCRCRCRCRPHPTSTSLSTAKITRTDSRRAFDHAFDPRYPLRCFPPHLKKPESELSLPACACYHYPPTRAQTSTPRSFPASSSSSSSSPCCCCCCCSLSCGPCPLALLKPHITHILRKSNSSSVRRCTTSAKPALRHPRFVLLLPTPFLRHSHRHYPPVRCSRSHNHNHIHIHNHRHRHRHKIAYRRGLRLSVHVLIHVPRTGTRKGGTEMGTDPDGSNWGYMVLASRRGVWKSSRMC
jgi:hypothetical protein